MQLVLVGGDSVIVPNTIRGVSNIVQSEYSGVANAIGAFIAQISGQYEQIYIYSREPCEDSLKDPQDKAMKQAILAGALSETIQLVEVEETALAYHPENATRLKVEVVGKMK
ncbi:hypothetical protein QUF87_18320 [Lysinibacillus pakistanensis]|nr:hypothetical protein [Lysinibacillus pakistanensis]